MSCNVPERARSIPSPEKLASVPDGILCSKVFVQVDYGIVDHFGIQGARDFVEGAMSEVAIPFMDIDVELSFTYDYLLTPIYAPGSSYDMLIQFQANTPVFDGDVATLLYLDSSGGIAWVNTACKQSNPFRYSMSNIQTTYLPYREGYSWLPHVVAHELGHNYGSPHTHDPVWNGNNTPIDGCGGGNGPIPHPTESDIMSYCHLTQQGMTFDLGFGPQPAAVIRENIYSRCTTCDNPSGPEDPDPPVATCSDNTVFLGLITDIFPSQTSYTVTDAFGSVIHQRGPFPDSLAGEFIGDTLCLSDGCYTYTITDVDGLAPHPKFPCVEGIYRVGDPFGEFGSGQDFTGSETVRICVGDYDEPGGCEPKGPYRDSLSSYANQDRTGGVSVFGENFIKLSGNTWKVQPLGYTVTPLTVLYAQIKVEQLGEIHAFAFSTDPSGISPSTTLRFAGTQAWGREVTQVPTGEWVDIAIPVGQLIPNVEYSHLGFVNDYDPDRVAVTGFRNIELCEDGTGQMIKSAAIVEGSIKNEVVVEDIVLRPYPNPVTDTVTLPDADVWFLFASDGKPVDFGHGKKVDMSFLPPGLYLLYQAGQTHKVIKQ